MKELIEQKQFAQFRKEVVEYNEADVAAVLEELDEKERVKVFRLLPKDIAADVFAYLPIEIEQEIITSLSEKEAGSVIDNLYSDDAAALVEEMPANVVRRILANTTPETRRDINTLLQYPDDSAGSIMTVDFVDFKDNITVADALLKLRRVGLDKESVDVCYVLDKARHLLGIVTLRKLILSEPDDVIVDIMNDHVITVKTLTDQEEVARTIQKYDINSVPVVDSENRLVGIVTIDDIVDVIEQEATEDIEMMAAITPTDKPYMKTSVFETWKKRIPWLLLLMISATFTGGILSAFEAQLATFPVLIAFIPMLMDTGGNAGGQASVTIIRGLSLDEIHYGDVFRVVWKEFRVSILCGVTLSAANFVKLLLIDKVGLLVAFIICISLVVTVVVAKFVGCTLPILAKRIGFDPAVMASPFITTIVDALSLLVYCNIAIQLLQNTAG